MEPEDVLSNVCADFVSEKRFEPALVYLFRDRAAGEWVPLADLYRRAGASAEGVRAATVVMRLPVPSGDDDSALVYFCDEELMWSTTAFYNVARLFRAPQPA